MRRWLFLAAVLVVSLGLVQRAPAGPTPIGLVGDFTDLDSFTCYPLHVDGPPADSRQFFVQGNGTVFFHPADTTCATPLENPVYASRPIGEPLVFDLRMKRDLNAPTVNGGIIAGYGDGDQIFQRVTYTPDVPRLNLERGFLSFPQLDRNGCYYFVLQSYPETAPNVVTVTSSTTSRVPDLEIFDRTCTYPVDTVVRFDPANFTLGYFGVKRAARNAGTRGTLIATADPAFTVDGNPYPVETDTLVFRPRATLRLTALYTSNLDATSCVRATVSVGQFNEVPTMRVRLYSGTGNARVYTRGCLSTIAYVDLPPGGSRDVYFKPVADDVTYASLVADTNNAGNLEVTAPAAAGVTFFYYKNYATVN
ncbi:MAG TPA: hypothetical protein VGM22_12580 [Methylomirabilota bacterium]|jgi:hypothetical protein